MNLSDALAVVMVSFTTLSHKKDWYWLYILKKESNKIDIDYII